MLDGERDQEVDRQHLGTDADADADVDEDADTAETTMGDVGRVQAGGG